ncbi:MAG: response regulator [Woeseia sp.]
MPVLKIPQPIFGYGEILRVLRALKEGDFAVRMSTDLEGLDGEIAAVFNDIVEMNAAMAAEFARIRYRGDKEGQIHPGAAVSGTAGSWAECVDSIDKLIGELARPASGTWSGDRQEELQRSTEQLQAKIGTLAGQMKTIEYKYQQSKAAAVALGRKLDQLALHSKYKSEFLANMSHELRTPLNSLLILAHLLTENATGNLTPKQVEYAQTIRMSGNDLLALIDDILDLSKVESGRVRLHITQEKISELQVYLQRTFLEIARDRGLEFRIAVDKGLPSAIQTDMQRLRQILQNLLSNAFKFTAKGTVSLEVSLAASGWTRGNRKLDDAEKVVAFAVVDTGIGVAKDKQQMIFEAFQQADGSARRKFEGTGLGLSISAELARLLGGEIRVESSLGIGSTFTLYLPLGREPDSSDGDAAGARSEGQAAPLLAGNGEAGQQDDRQGIRPGDRVVLIAVNDAKYSAGVLNQVRALGFKGLIATNVHTALVLANEFLPNVVTVGVNPQDMVGWAIVNLLREDPATRQIPVNVFSIGEQEQPSICMGSLGFVSEPSRAQTLADALRKLASFNKHEAKTLLVAAQGVAQRKRIIDDIAALGRHTISAATGKNALKVLRKQGGDCTMIVQGLTDMAPLALVRDIFKTGGMDQVSIVVHTVVDSNGGIDHGELNEFAEILVLKRLASTEAVLEEIARCLHAAIHAMPPGQRRPVPGIWHAVPALAGKTVLIVDDDVRSSYALASALERQDMTVLSAANGPDGIAMLNKHPDISIILMDMMMPGQDGYQTMGLIRDLEQFRSVPVIAVTARAMKGDRQKCIKAGASDYIAKPINVEQMLSVLEVWLGD